MIYPEEFPEDRNNEIAEKKVYHAMKKTFSREDFDVFYDRTFRGRFKGERLDYQIDFIVADLRNNRFNGLICIEVKGGILEYKANGSWFQYEKKLDTSPTEQAITSMNSLVKKRFSEIEENVYYHWMLCFPDVISPDNNKLPPNLTEDQIIDNYKLSSLRTTLISYFDNLAKSSPDRTGMDLSNYNKIFKSSLIRDCNFTLPLSTKIDVNEKTFIRLTAKQGEILRMVQDNDRIIVKGIAGSGKTLIAREIALEYYEKGLNVLFLCYNKVLSLNIKYFFESRNKVYVNSYLGNLDLDIDSLMDIGKLQYFGRRLNDMKISKERIVKKDNMVKVETYHSFAYSVIATSDPGWWDKHFNDPDFWSFIVPLKIEEINKTGGVSQDFDVVIIDEGQDFMEDWYTTVECFLKPAGKFYIFMDELQNINLACSRIPGNNKFTKIRLDENCRNTKQIASKLTKIIKQEIRSKDEMPNGDPVVVVQYRNNIDQQTKILQEIRNLFGESKMRPDQILILLNTEKSSSCLAGTTRVDNLPLQKLSDDGKLNNNVVNYTRINTYKGLEADIVFIIDTDKVVYDEKVFYTQASRAKHLLYIFEKIE